MAPSTPEHTLLFGLLALHAGLVRAAPLLDALNTWGKDRSRPLDTLLCEKGFLRTEERDLLNSLIEALLRRHDNDAARSLAALLPPGALPLELQALDDADLRACLARAGHGPSAVTECQAPTTPTVTPHGNISTTPTVVTGSVEGGGVASSRGGSSRYRILRRHARGGLGEVFVAHDEELQREVALKEMQAQHLTRADTRARFLLEGEITGRLEHPGVVPVYGLGTYADGRPFYVMRFIRGESLTDAIRNLHTGKARDPGEHGLQLRKLLARFVDVCNAIAYAHSHGVLHRDLKPDNIMLGEFGETLVVDWGLAKTLTSEGLAACGLAGDTARPQVADPSLGVASTVGQVIGTPPYMSPEQAAGRGDRMGPASDVYSLGATLYALLVGQKPFPSDPDVQKVLRLVQSGSFLPPRAVNPYVSKPLDAVCLKAMALRPEDRYTSAKELAADVERWLADEPVSAYREPFGVRARRWARRHRTAVTAGALAGVTGVIALCVSYLLLAQEQKRTEEAIEQRALAQVEALLEANPRAVPDLLRGLDTVRELVRARLVRERHNPSGDDPARRRQRQTRASLALLDEDEDESDFLRERLLAGDLDPEEFLLLRDFLAPYSARLVPNLWAVVDDHRCLAGRRFRSLAALADFDSDNERWDESAGLVVGPLLTADPLHVGIWTRALRPVAEHLIGPLSVTFADPLLPAERRVAATVLREYAHDNPALLVQLLGSANETQMALLLPRLQEHRRAVLPLLHKALAVPSPPSHEAEEKRDTHAQQQANLAVVLLHLGDAAPVWPLLRRSAYPDTRTHLIHALARCAVDPVLLTTRLEKEQDDGIRQALVLALGAYTQEQLPELKRAPTVPLLLNWYRTQADPGLHSALDWLLRHGPVESASRKFDWKQTEELARIDRELHGKPAERRQWYVTPHGQTMVLLGPDEFLMGSPEKETLRLADETLHRRRIGRRFALASKEVTAAQFRQFLDANPKVVHRGSKRYSPEKDCPEVIVTWYEAAQFCRWLSDLEKLPETEMCFPSVEEIEKCKDGKTPLRLPADYLSRIGYRLPTEAEWEYACRAGSRTSRPHGVSNELLLHYAWDVREALDRTWPVGLKKPNDFGLFDMLGNAAEWCLDLDGDYPPSRDGKVVEDQETVKEITGQSRCVLRGAPFQPRPTPLRSAYRYWHYPTDQFSTIGLRVARTHR